MPYKDPAKRRVRRRAYYAENSVHIRAREGPRQKVSRLQLKTDVIHAYGDHCVCCGEIEIVFLDLDHIHNNGNRHRREIGQKGGTGFYHWLKKNNFPPGFQILCRNCNWAKFVLGRCPHQDVLKLILKNTSSDPVSELERVRA